MLLKITFAITCKMKFQLFLDFTRGSLQMHVLDIFRYRYLTWLDKFLRKQLRFDILFEYFKRYCLLFKEYRRISLRYLLKQYLRTQSTSEGLNEPEDMGSEAEGIRDTFLMFNLLLRSSISIYLVSTYYEKLYLLYLRHLTQN